MSYWRIKKCWNVIFNFSLEDINEMDADVVSFSTRYDANLFFEKLKSYFIKTYSQYGINEAGREASGYRVCWTNDGPYLFVRMVGCELLSGAYRCAEYFNKGGE